MLQLINLIQLSVCEYTIKLVIVKFYTLNWNKLVDWNDMVEHRILIKSFILRVEQPWLTFLQIYLFIYFLNVLLFKIIN